MKIHFEWGSENVVVSVDGTEKAKLLPEAAFVNLTDLV